jgi:hypothetical protein
MKRKEMLSVGECRPHTVIEVRLLFIKKMSPVGNPTGVLLSIIVFAIIIINLFPRFHTGIVFIYIAIAV